MEYKEFGTRIAQVRIERGMSASELSLQVNRDASYVSQVEAGKVNISMKTMLEICKVLNIEPCTLFNKPKD